MSENMTYDICYDQMSYFKIISYRILMEIPISNVKTRHLLGIFRNPCLDITTFLPKTYKSCYIVGVILIDEMGCEF